MLFKDIQILHHASYLPPTILTSAELEQRLAPAYDYLNLNVGRLELMTGITERRVVENNDFPSDLSYKAAQKCLEEVEELYDFKSQDIDLLIHSSVCRDYLEPATASRVHHLLKLNPMCQLFDLSTACLGFIQSIVVAASMIEQGAIKNALICSGENGTPLIKQTIQSLNSKALEKKLSRQEMKMLFSNLTIGSGAVAMILSKASDFKGRNPGLRKLLLGGQAVADSAGHQLCLGHGDNNSLQMRTDSEKLLEAGIKLSQKTWQLFKQKFNVPFRYFFTHQVGRAHQEALRKSLEISENQDYLTYPNLGNIGSSALPLAFDLAMRDSNFGVKEIKEDIYAAFLGIGSGLSSLMLAIKLQRE